ncbi:MAG: phosphoribosylglycinamide formyltransferase, partial [Oscillospiraceae bacterium]
MQKARIAVLVSGGGTNLQALLDAEKAGIIKSGEICLVMSNKSDAYALTRAENAGIKAVSVTKADYPEPAAAERRMIEILDSEKIDLIVLAGFLKVLSADFTKHFENRIINIHPSLIPSFCGDGFYGLHVHEAALSYGVKVTGATVHYVNEITDGGKIILQKAVEVKDGDTSESLQKRVMQEAEWVILPQAAETVCAK